MSKLQYLVRFVVLLAVVAAVCLPLSLCPLVKATKLEPHGGLGYVLLISSILGSVWAVNLVLSTVVKRAGGSVRIHPVGIVAYRVALFELFALVCYACSLAAPGLLTLTSLSGLAIMYGGMGLAFGLTDVADAYLVSKFKK